MKNVLSLIALGMLAIAADNPWSKVRELKGGTELRIYKKDAKQPLLAKMDQATEESIVIVVKNEQISVPKEDIDRVDYRPVGGSRITKQTTTKTNAVGNPPPSDQRIGGPSPGPYSSTSSGLSIGPKPDFETIYRRQVVAPKK